MKKILIVLLAMVVLGLFITQAYAEDLELLSWNWGQPYKGNNVVVVNGEVKNISDHPIKWIRVVVTFYTKDGTYITHHASLGMAFNPIMPTQVSPFKVLVGWNPWMYTAKIEFQDSDPSSATATCRISCKSKNNIKKMD